MRLELTDWNSLITDISRMVLTYNLSLLYKKYPIFLIINIFQFIIRNYVYNKLLFRLLFLYLTNTLQRNKIN